MTKGSAQKFTKATGAQVGSMLAHAQSEIGRIRQEIQRLQDEVKADDDSISEYNRNIDLLQAKRDDINRKVVQLEQRKANGSVSVDPLKQKYEETLPTLIDTFEKAKAGHTKAIQLLVDEFGYHPAFKRWSDEI